MQDRDSWFQDYDGYCESAYRWQEEQEREEYEADHAVEKHQMEKHNGRRNEK